MKNIFRVFANDWKRIGRNVVALVVVMGLSVLPSLYAWFNILSNWDPYGSDSTSNIMMEEQRVPLQRLKLQHFVQFFSSR
jgi:hypothetical protein